jgi:hypothetical protein
MATTLIRFGIENEQQINKQTNKQTNKDVGFEYLEELFSIVCISEMNFESTSNITTLI